MNPLPYQPGMAGDVIKPYLDADGKTFAKDFYMVNRLGAMAGALVDDYNHANLILGMDGAFAHLGAHSFVVGPDNPEVPWNSVLTSPGTPAEFGGPGWNPLGASYQYNDLLKPPSNYNAWWMSGCPKRNAWGDWSNGGKPPIPFVYPNQPYPSANTTGWYPGKLKKYK